MKLILISILFGISALSYCQNNLAILYSSNGMEYGKASAVDYNNNYINGSLFQNTINVNPNGTTNLTAPGMATQMALTKYNELGQLVWANHVGGSTTSESPHGIDIDVNNNIYVAGYFGSTVLAGAQNADFNPLGGGTITTEGNEDIFVAKYDSNGLYQWAFALGNIGQETQERAWDLATDSIGNSYVVGGFHGTMNFNPLGSPMNYSLSDSTAGLFIAKYNSSGIAQWVVILDVKGNSVFAETYATCDLDERGNLYVAGNFRGSNVDFNPLGTANRLSSLGQNDIFLTKYDASNGNLSWVKRIGSPAQDLVAPGALRCDNNGNPYFTGRLSGVNAVNFDPNGGINNVTNSSLFLASYDTNGNLRFTEGMNSGVGDGGHRVEFDDSNNVYIAGWVNNSSTFGNITLTSSSVVADNFLAKYSNDLSTCYWALNFGGTNATLNNIVAGLSVDQNNHPIITGQLYGINANVNPLGNSPHNLSSNGNNDCFIIKYDSNGLLWERAPLSIQNNKQIRPIKIFPNPVTDIINIHTEHSIDKAELFNLNGEKIDLSFQNNEIEVSLLSKGIYVLRLIDINGKIYSSKFIKK